MIKKHLHKLRRIKKINKVGLVFVLSLILVAASFAPTKITTKDTLAEESIEQLNRNIGDKREEIERLEENQENLEKEIEEKQKEKQSLESNIEILDAEIARAKNDIKKTQLEIDKITIEIKGAELKILEKEDQITRQKKILGEYLRVIQQYDDKSPLELLLGYTSFSDFLDQAKYLETLENKGQESLDDIQELKSELLWHKRVLTAKNEKLTELRDDLQKKKSNLDSEKSAKNRLLVVTEEQEEKYQELLEQSRKEYEQVNIEITGLEQTIEQQLSAQTTTQKPADFQEYSGSGTLSWPVNPAKGISAYFMDPTYKDYFGVPHYGIDIPAAQGSTIYAPADGYVVKYRNAGYGYSYLLIHHGNGLSTVYGHIPASLVSEGSYVKKGDPIAKVGGTPGTPGAGWMTTGAHLHFETRLNGQPVNPLNYLQ